MKYERLKALHKEQQREIVSKGSNLPLCSTPSKPRVEYIRSPFTSNGVMHSGHKKSVAGSSSNNARTPTSGRSRHDDAFRSPCMLTSPSIGSKSMTLKCLANTPDKQDAASTNSPTRIVARSGKAFIAALYAAKAESSQESNSDARKKDVVTIPQQTRKTGFVKRQGESILGQIPGLFRDRSLASTILNMASEDTSKRNISTDKDSGVFGLDLNKSETKETRTESFSLGIDEENNQEDPEDKKAYTIQQMFGIANNVPLEPANKRISPVASNDSLQKANALTDGPAKQVVEDAASVKDLIRPNKFVNSKALRRASSRTFSLPNNYQDFLSTEEREAFADVIKEIEHPARCQSSLPFTEEPVEDIAESQTNPSDSCQKPIPKKKVTRSTKLKKSVPQGDYSSSDDSDSGDDTDEESCDSAGSKRKGKKGTSKKGSAVRKRKLKDDVDNSAVSKKSKASSITKPIRPFMVNTNFRSLKMKSKGGSRNSTGTKFSWKTRGSSSKYVAPIMKSTNELGEIELEVPQDGQKERDTYLAASSLDGVADFFTDDIVDAEDVVQVSIGPLSKKVDLRKALVQLSSLQSFRPGQKEALSRILEGKNTLVVLPTGGGKSLCYQLPAFVLRHAQEIETGITIVVSPTISLMLDQIRCLPSGLRAACLSSTNYSSSATKEIYNKLQNREIDVLFVAPERLQSASFIEMVNSKIIPPVHLACIDEAHCMSEWSHNFRTSYLHVCGILKNTLQVKCLVGLTGTATLRERASLCEMLEVDPTAGVVTSSVIRDNLVLSVSKVLDNDGRDAALLALLRTETYRQLDSIIIYTMFQAQADRIAQYLRVRDFDADSYHAGKPASQREYVQTRFQRGTLRIIVATIAFGLGINKSDVRSVIHYSMPKSVEDYVQEIGRSGRDGKKAFCHLFLSQDDYIRNRSFAFTNGVDEVSLWTLLQKLFCLQSGGAAKRSKKKGHEETDAQHGCRNDMILSIAELEAETDTKESVLATIMSYLDLMEDNPLTVLPTTYARHTIYCSKPKLDELCKSSTLVKSIVDNGKQVRYGVEFETSRVIGDCDMTVQEMTAELKKLQAEKRLKYSTDVKAFHVRPNVCLTRATQRQSYLEGLRDELIEKMNRLEMQFVWKLDKLYEMLREAATSIGKLNDTDVTTTSDSIDANASLACNEALTRRIESYFEETVDIQCQDTNKWGFRDPELIEKHRISKFTVEIAIRTFIREYSECIPSGRMVARIFHGLSSPCFPAKEWGSNKSWGVFAYYNFRELMRLAGIGLLEHKAKHGARKQG